MHARQVFWLCGTLLWTGCGEDFFDDSQPSAPEDGDEVADENDDPPSLPATTHSGVVENRVARELGGDEASDFCSWASSNYESLLAEDLGQTCTLFAGGFGASAEECSLLVDDCVTELEASGFSSEDDSCYADLSDCAATVGEIEACLEEQYDALAALLGAVSCEGGLPAELEAQYATIPAACVVVQAKCPGMFEDTHAEQLFACNSDEFDETVPLSFVCDGRADCSNGADEVGCDAALRHFVCDDGTVITQDDVCDNNFDCPTGEDELSCS